MLAYMLAIALSSGPTSGQLVFLGGTRDQIQLIEPESIHREGEYVRYDQVTVMAVPESFYGGRMTRARRFFYRVDCLTRSHQATGFALLDGDGALLADHSTGGPAMDMMRPAPGSVADKAVAIACGDEMPGDTSEVFADVPSAIRQFYAIINPR